MGDIKKDHVFGAGAAALAGGAAGGAVGMVVGGPVGLVVGAAAGGALGAIAGDRASEAVAPDDDIGRFRQVFDSMPYYVSGMTWDDYEPAYRYGIAQYRDRERQGGHEPFAVAEPALEAGWEVVRGKSRLLWSEAREAVEHVWRWFDEARDKTEHYPPPRA